MTEKSCGHKGEDNNKQKGIRSTGQQLLKREKGSAWVRRGAKPLIKYCSPPIAVNTLHVTGWKSVSSDTKKDKCIKHFKSLSKKND